MSRAQLKHLLLDVNFKDKPQVVNLEAEFSPLARLFYMDLMAAMSSATNARITKSVARVLGSRIGIDPTAVNEIITFCLTNGLLELEGDMITNSRVIKDQESYAKKLASVKERVTRFREKGNADVTRNKTVTPDNVYDYDNDLNNNGTVPDYSSFSDEDRKKYEFAEVLLVPTTEPRIQKSNQFINASRRPMKQWRDIWLSPFELVKVLEEMTEAGMDKKSKHKVFDGVQSRILTKVAEGAAADRIPVFTWLTGFALTEALAQIKAKNDAERSNNYLNESRRT